MCMSEHRDDPMLQRERADDAVHLGEDEAAGPSIQLSRVIDLVGTDETPLSASQVATERLLAARDRAAALVDRRAAARDRARARTYLRQAQDDDLTGVLQRRPGLVQLARAVTRAQAGDWPLVVAFLDVDHLKYVNDSRGHAAGDELLREVGGALKRSLRERDVVIRYGGDEFVCALPHASLDDAIIRISDVSAALADALPDASISFGLVALQPDETCEAVIQRADLEMYAARRRHRGTHPNA
jgi:diguanylate cyclase (GGDEF)-like protein